LRADAAERGLPPCSPRAEARMALRSSNLRFVLTAIAASAALSASPADLQSGASAASPDAEHGKILYLKHCVVCHRSRAWGDGPREIPAIAGQQRWYLIEQLALFASGERQGSLMHGPAMHDTLRKPDLSRPQAIADLAAFLASVPGNPEPEYSEGRALAAGRSTYALSCAGCHGSAGAGSESVPAIGAQHYGYLLGQLHAFASGRRGHPTFLGLSGDQQEAVADYVSRLRP